MSTSNPWALVPPFGRASARRLPILLCLLFFAPFAGSLVAQDPATADPDVAAEIDAFWDGSERSVVEGDFQAYAALYHPDAVLVTAASGTSVPIAAALAGWKSLFDDTREGRMAADLEIRISRRMTSPTTSHETGIFRYVSHPVDGDPEVGLVHFEALLVKGEDGWKWIMEYQKGPATLAEWEALAN